MLGFREKVRLEGSLEKLADTSGSQADPLGNEVAEPKSMNVIMSENLQDGSSSNYTMVKCSIEEQDVFFLAKKKMKRQEAIEQNAN